MAGLGIVTVPHPIGGIAEELVARKAIAAVDQVQAALIGTVAVGGAPGAVTEGAVAEGAVARHPAPDDLLDFQTWLMERGWGDGLPAIPATAERVKAMLAGTRRSA
jgi:hypothetical protein